MDESNEVFDDFAHLARLATQQSYEDVRLLLARLVRKYRSSNPTLAARLNQSLKGSQTRATSSSMLRRDHAGMDTATATQWPVDLDSKLALIRVFDDTAGLPEPILPESLHEQIASIIKERMNRKKLIGHGISPTRSAILIGPPGVGKTLSARWIASALGQPLWVLDLTAVMSSLLGKTGNNVRAALDYAKSNQAVLLLDEIDAIAKRRSDESDIGELKRLVTVILQEVDQWPDTGLLLAATNHPELVDPALWRRFDAVLIFNSADDAAIEAALRRFLGPDLPVFEPWIGMLSTALNGASISDVERVVATMRRARVIQETPPDELVFSVIGQRIEWLGKQDRIEMAVAMAHNGCYSHHEISRMTGVARDTIRKHAGPSSQRGRRKR